MVEYPCRICSSSDNKTKKCPKRGLANSSSVKQPDDYSGSKIQEFMEKEKAICGKCPLCKDRHTYYKARTRETWPSDRMFKCEKFKNMNVKERAAALEKFSCCSMCTSWNHKKDLCKSIARCTQEINGNKCNKEHSFMVCGSGNAYCGAVRPALFSSSSSSSEESESDSSIESSSVASSVIFPDLHAETLLILRMCR